MRAIRINEHGDFQRLQMQEVPVPQPKSGEITIDVAFAGIGFVDTLMRSGAFAFARLPFTPGIEISGTVRAVSPGVGLRQGQRVAALLTDFSDGGMGGYAEVVRAKAALTVPLDPDDDLAMAAATMANGATAVMATEDLEPGTVTAVSGASGGLGQRLIASAAWKGATRIVAISSGVERAQTLLGLGATEIVRPDAFRAGAEEIDAAFDTAGGRVRTDLARRLRVGGRLLLLGNAIGHDDPIPGDDVWLRCLEVRGISTGALSSLDPQRVASAAMQALAIARARPTAHEVLPIEDAAEAHCMIEARRGPGKLVLKVA